MRGHGFKFHVWPRNPRGTLIASHGCMGSGTWIATPNMKFEDMTPDRPCPTWCVPKTAHTLLAEDMTPDRPALNGGIS